MQIDNIFDENEYSLEHIIDTLEGISDAISSALSVDVTIMDNKFKRLAGTGQYKSEIGCTIDNKSVFSVVLRTGIPIVINNPRENKACDQCKDRTKCSEYAQACCPIIVEGKIVGIIGLIAFDESTKNQIINNEGNLTEFLKRMADLIASKMTEVKHTAMLNKKSQETKILLDSVDCYIISVNPKLQITNFNDKACIEFDLKKGLSIDKLGFDKNMIKNQFDSSDDTFGVSFEFVGNKGYKRYIFDIKPITYKSKIIEIVLVITKVNQIINVVNDVIKANSISNFDEIIGESEAIKRTIEIAKRSSSGTSTVLIQGESGTGKELFARAIHSYSNRGDKPFIAINCAAIPENLLESELFGYEEGTFTGAMKGGKLGKFELANKGTIFLDEIGDMPLHIQSKLLRVLQEKEVERLGAKQPTPIDIRVIAATNKNLEEMVNNGEFRADLYYRLNVIPLLIPSLKERVGDIEILCSHFIKKYNSKLDKNIDDISNEALNILNNYNWVGNVRELENTIEYSVNMANGDIIEKLDLPVRFSREQLNFHEASVDITVNNLSLLEKREIKKAITMYGRDKSGIVKVIEALGISRATLYRKIKEYNI